MNATVNAPEGIRELVQIPERANASACFGAPATSGDRVVIPVAEVTYGFGLGWGGGTGNAGTEGGSGGGAGGASRVRGIAVIEVAPDGVRVHPVLDTTSITLSTLAFITGATAITSRTLLKLIRG